MVVTELLCGSVQHLKVRKQLVTASHIATDYLWDWGNELSLR